MSNPNGERGARWNRAVVAYLKERVTKRAERLYGEGRALDQGDVLIPQLDGIVIHEAKDEARHDFSGYIKEANQERDNAEAKIGVAVVKRRGYGAKDAYVVMDLESWCWVLGVLMRAAVHNEL